MRSVRARRDFGLERVRAVVPPSGRADGHVDLAGQSRGGSSHSAVRSSRSGVPKTRTSMSAGGLRHGGDLPALPGRVPAVSPFFRVVRCRAALTGTGWRGAQDGNGRLLGCDGLDRCCRAAFGVRAEGDRWDSRGSVADRGPPRRQRTTGAGGDGRSVPGARPVGPRTSSSPRSTDRRRCYGAGACPMGREWRPWQARPVLVPGVNCLPERLKPPGLEPDAGLSTRSPGWSVSRHRTRRDGQRFAGRVGREVARSGRG